MNITRTTTTNPHGLTLTTTIPSPQMVRFDGQMVPVDKMFEILHETGFTVDESFAWIARRIQ
jgi:hypothetical protein